MSDHGARFTPVGVVAIIASLAAMLAAAWVAAHIMYIAGWYEAHERSYAAFPWYQMQGAFAAGIISALCAFSGKPSAMIAAIAIAVLTILFVSAMWIGTIA